MRWSDITATPSPRQLREFGVIFTLIAGGFTCWALFVWRDTTLSVFMGLVTVLSAGVTFLKPRLLAPVFTGWMVLVFPIAWLVSTILLMIVFFAVVSPIALIFRLIGRDALDRRWEPEQDSYWRKKELPDDPTQYLRQY